MNHFPVVRFLAFCPTASTSNAALKLFAVWLKLTKNLHKFQIHLTSGEWLHVPPRKRWWSDGFLHAFPVIALHRWVRPPKRNTSGSGLLPSTSNAKRHMDANMDHGSKQHNYVVENVCFHKRRTELKQLSCLGCIAPLRITSRMTQACNSNCENLKVSLSLTIWPYKSVLK